MSIGHPRIDEPESNRERTSSVIPVETGIQEIAALARLWRGASRLAMTVWDFLPWKSPLAPLY